MNIRLLALLFISFIISTPFNNIVLAQTAKKAPVYQPVPGYRSAKILSINGLSFKDLNRNNKLDKYEDWRLPYEVSAKDIVAQMLVEQKVGFMLISSTRLKNDWSFKAPKNKEPITSDINEEDLVQTTNVF